MAINARSPMSSKELCSPKKRFEPVKDENYPNQKMAAGRSEKLEHCANAVTTSQPRNITELNDDCLLETFSHMRIADLCAVKGCCRRICYLAESSVEKGFRNKCLVLPNMSSYRKGSVFLVAFGKFLTNLKVSNVKPWLGEYKCKIHRGSNSVFLKVPVKSSF